MPIRPILIRGIEVPAHISPEERQNYADRMIEARANTVVEVAMEFPDNPRQRDESLAGQIKRDGLTAGEVWAAEYVARAVHAACVYAAGQVRQKGGTPPMEHQAVMKVLARAAENADRIMAVAATSKRNWSRALGEWAAGQVLAEARQMLAQLGGKSEHSGGDR